MRPDKSRVNAYLKYSGLAFQLFGTMAIGAIIGRWIDQKMSTEKPYFTLLSVTIFFIAAMVWVYVDLQKTRSE
ncbi:MAG: AtpZ/AtpI family protein [Saprospiraceae bacterium]|nr:AtpZ/AtpI family protein [Candidatus Vicinibacter affinis]MBK7799837.1 AtpZ/AtpI family protein [Candidatus Vicinibacter affinis]